MRFSLIILIKNRKIMSDLSIVPNKGEVTLYDPRNGGNFIADAADTVGSSAFTKAQTVEIPLTSKYYSFSEVGKEIKVYYLGIARNAPIFDPRNKKWMQKDVVKWMMSDKLVYEGAQAKLVGQFEALDRSMYWDSADNPSAPLKCITIRFDGMKQGKSGNLIADFTLLPLDVQKKK